MVIERSNINRTHPHNFQLAFIPFLHLLTFSHIYTHTYAPARDSRTHTPTGPTLIRARTNNAFLLLLLLLHSLAAHSIRVAAAAAAAGLLSLSPRRPRGRGGHGELAHVAHGRLRFELDQRYVLGRQTLIAAPFGVHLRLDDVECRLR